MIYLTHTVAAADPITPIGRFRINGKVSGQATRSMLHAVAQRPNKGQMSAIQNWLALDPEKASGQMLKQSDLPCCARLERIALIGGNNNDH